MTHRALPKSVLSLIDITANEAMDSVLEDSDCYPAMLAYSKKRLRREAPAGWRTQALGRGLPRYQRFASRGTVICAKLSLQVATIRRTMIGAVSNKQAVTQKNKALMQRTEIKRKHLCWTARQLQDEIAKCLRFMRDSRASIESGRLPMFANTHQSWCVAEEALHTVWVKLHYDAISHGVGRSDLRTAWGVLERPK